MNSSLLSVLIGAPILSAVLTGLFTRKKIRVETQSIIATGAEAVANGAASTVATMTEAMYELRQQLEDTRRDLLQTREELNETKRLAAALTLEVGILRAELAKYSNR